MSRFLASDIVWDTDGEDSEALGLPSSIEVEADDEDDVSGVLSDAWGWCIQTLNIEPLPEKA